MFQNLKLYEIMFQQVAEGANDCQKYYSQKKYSVKGSEKRK